MNETMPKSAILAILAILLLAGLAACSPLKSFNFLVPKDGGVARAGSAVAYGASPRQVLDIYAPQGSAGVPRPIIVFIYGGSWQSGSRVGYAFAARALASRGFVVVVPDYRLVPEVRFPGFVEDGATAVRWVRANAARYGGDPDRIVLMGHSAGAYNAAMLAVDPRFLGADRAAVRGFIGLAGPYDFLPLDDPATLAAFAGAPDLRATQPVNLASADDPPALLLHGVKDDRVFPRNSQALGRKLSAAGVRGEVKLYDNLGHIGIVMALSTALRGTAPVLEDAVRFVREVTNAPTPARR